MIVYPVAPRDTRQVVTPTIERGGVIMAMRRDVTLLVSSSDHIGGDASVAEMKIWGDLDPEYRPECFATTEGAARWIPYQPTVDLVLLAGNGQRSISSKLRTTAGKSTDAMTTTFTLDSEPHLSLLWADQIRVLGQRLLRFGFSPSHDIDAWDVTLAPTTQAIFPECVSIIDGGPTTAGSLVNVTIDASDVIAGDHFPSQGGVKLVRVFMLYRGQWYSGAWTSSFEPTAGRWDSAQWDLDYWSEG